MSSASAISRTISVTLWIPGLTIVPPSSVLCHKIVIVLSCFNCGPSLTRVPRQTTSPLVGIARGYHSGRHLRSRNLPDPYTPWLLLAVVGIKPLLSRYVSSVGKGIDSTAVRSDGWHHLSDAITSAFVFVGISIALFTKSGEADGASTKGPLCDKRSCRPE